MSTVTIVGSGASGVNFALALLDKGYSVTMIDIGFAAPEPLHTQLSFNDLKEKLDDPARYFLGDGFEGVVRPDSEGEYYGFPPSKNYVFEEPDDFGFRTSGFSPLFSFARGGLAEAWTAGCYPFSDADLGAFPFAYDDLAPYYNEVSRRIGVTGADDDLSRFLPLHENLLPTLKLDRHSQMLLDAYDRKRTALNADLGCYVGRTRVATLSRDHEGRRACDYLGRCLWGCPIQALYTPSQTLNQCRAQPNFKYVSEHEVTHFRTNDRNEVTEVVARSLATREPLELPVERLVLAAGTLRSSEIVLRSVYEATGSIIRLGGLMDNRQVLMPFLNLRLIGQPFDDQTYQYHLLGLGLETKAAPEYVHGQITTLKTAMMHPIIQRLPFDLRTSAIIGRAMHAALGVVNLNFHDTRRDENYITLIGDGSGSEPRLALHYSPDAAEPRRLRDGMARTRKALRKLGCIVPPGMTHVRPMGASVHYAGTLPMTGEGREWTTDENCRSRDFPNLYIVDGSTFPFLPAKNITFTLMANALRVAAQAF